MAANTYDAIPYDTHPRADNHPSLLGAMARLYGMEPAAVEECRMLELGCGNGANLIPMAYELRGSRFVGVDLAPGTVEKGRAEIRELGLTNIELRAEDLLEFPEDSGTFDYILAHGLFSWTPERVREKILEICARHLAPQGVAFVSYNALPGGYLRMMTRETLRHHTRNFDSLQEQLAQGRGFVEYLLKAQRGDDPMRAAFVNELKLTQTFPDSLFAHDLLEENNAHFFFHEFMELAQRHGLQFLAEAEFASSYAPDLFPGMETLRREQYLDLVHNRRFRQTLLCRADVALDRTITAKRLERLAMAANVRPVSEEPNLAAGVVEQFRTQKGSQMETNHPAMKSALVEMWRAWPRPMPFPELVNAAQARAPEETGEELAQFLVRLYGAGIASFHSYVPPIAPRAPERPYVSELARRELRRGPMATNLLHREVRLEGPAPRRLLLLLDGTRDRADLCRQMGMTAEELEERLREAAGLGLLRERAE